MHFFSHDGVCHTRSREIFYTLKVLHVKCSVTTYDRPMTGLYRPLYNIVGYPNIDDYWIEGSQHLTRDDIVFVVSGTSINGFVVTLTRYGMFYVLQEFLEHV